MTDCATDIPAGCSATSDVAAILHASCQHLTSADTFTAGASCLILHAAICVSGDTRRFTWHQAHDQMGSELNMSGSHSRRQ
jgi:hypothetical protein